MAKPKPSHHVQIDIDTTPMEPADRSISLLKRPANKMFARRFRTDDVHNWQRAATELGMSDTEFVERVMNAVADAVLGRSR